MLADYRERCTRPTDARGNCGKIRAELAKKCLSSGFHVLFRAEGAEKGLSSGFQMIFRAESSDDAVLCRLVGMSAVHLGVRCGENVGKSTKKPSQMLLYEGFQYPEPGMKVCV